MLSSSQRNPLNDLLHRPRPSRWSIFLRSPAVYLTHLLHLRRGTSPPLQAEQAVSAVCISDTHNSQPQLPYGDILIHAGDLTQSGSFKELQAALDWIKQQSHPHKIVVAGNHDLLLDTGCDDRPGGREASTERLSLSWGEIIYLRDSSTEVLCNNGRTLRVYGSPMFCEHGNWAFQYPRSRGREIWAGRVPESTDILVTHGPPRAHLDLLDLGCPGLLAEIWRIRPALHVFGHIHEGHGEEHLAFDDLQSKFELTVLAGGGFWNLICTMWAAVNAWLMRRQRAQTILVNSAHVGGLRDNERRPPVKVYI